MAVQRDLVEIDGLAADALDLVRLALAVLEALEHLAALPGRGQGCAALLQLDAATLELQRGLLLRALDALEPGLLGEQCGTRARSGLRDDALARGGGAGLGVGEQRDAPRAQRRLAAKASRARSSSWARTSRTRSREKTKGGLLTHP